MNPFKVGNRFIVISTKQTANRLGLPPNAGNILSLQKVLTVKYVGVDRIQDENSFWWALEDVRPAAPQIPTKGLAYQVYLQEEMSKC